MFESISTGLDNYLISYFMELEMNYVRCIKTALLLIVVVTCLGCKSKQEAPGVNTGAPPQKAGEIKAISGQNVTGAVATSPQDKSDAEAAAARVLAQMEAGDFPAVYKESTPGFKQIGSQASFVAKFQQTRQKTGVLKNPKETSFITRPDKTHVLIYRMENERFKTDMRLTLARSQSGKMELAGLNQHDELKK